MAFSVRNADPERPGPEAPAGDTYRHSLFFRSLACAASASPVVLVALLCWLAVSGASVSDLVPALMSFILSLVTEYQSGGRNLSTFRLTQSRLRQERPLRPNREISLDEIQRVFIGGGSVQIYTSPGPNPDLEFQRKLRGGDDLIETLAKRLPPGTEIEHPSGELSGQLGGRL